MVTFHPLTRRLTNIPARLGDYLLAKDGPGVARTLWQGKVDPTRPEGIKRTYIPLDLMHQLARNGIDNNTIHEGMLLFDPADLPLENNESWVKNYDLIGLCTFLAQRNTSTSVLGINLSQTGATREEQENVILNARSAFQGLRRPGQNDGYWPTTEKTALLLLTSNTIDHLSKPSAPWIS